MTPDGSGKDSGILWQQILNSFQRRLLDSADVLRHHSAGFCVMRLLLILTLIGLGSLAGCSKSSGWFQRSHASDEVEDDRGIARLTNEKTAELDSSTDDDREKKFQLTSMTVPTGEPSLTTLAPGDHFETQIQNAQGVVLVDFFADWCGPCKKQAVILHDLESVASQYGAKIIKVNIEEHKDVAKTFSVAKLPTLIVFKGGKVIDRQTGLTDRRSVERLLKM